MESTYDQMLASFSSSLFTGLGPGDSPLVILSPYFLVLSFVISSLFVFSSLSVIFDMPYANMHKVVF